MNTFDDLIEMRFVVTPDLDGRQLQYRYRLNTLYPHVFSEWKPVPTIFVTKKLEEPK